MPRRTVVLNGSWQYRDLVGGMMSTQAIYELIGYVGSVLIVVSLAMSSIIRLRMVNLAGALVFATYGALIGSIPVVLTNTVIAGLDIWYLRKDLSTRQQLTVVKVGRDDPFLREFISFNRIDIENFGFHDVEGYQADVIFVMLRDACPVGVFIGRADDQGELRVILDYVAPAFRDLKSGESLYSNDGARFSAVGVRLVTAVDVDPKQIDYFHAMGFVETDTGVMSRVVGSES